jgi:hypothetical protein
MGSRPSRKRVFRLAASGLLLLSAGATISVVGAWAAIVFMPRSVIFEPETTIESAKWPHTVAPDWPPNPRGTLAAWFGADRQTFVCWGGTGSDYRAYWMHNEDAGLPVRCLEGWVVTKQVGAKTDLPADHSLLRLTLPGVGHCVLPLCPLWPGFALNTLFYAAFAYGLWQIPLAIRRRRRRRANKCVKCGYDRAGLAENATCPECGTKAV